MNKEIKKDWINALKSGKYKQGQGKLRDNNCYCCLGILCDIIEPTAWVNTERGFTHNEKKYFLSDSILNNYLDLKTETLNELDILAVMNDSGKSFK